MSEPCGYCGRTGCVVEEVSDEFLPWSEFLMVRVPEHRHYRCSTHDERFTDSEQGKANERQMAESLRTVADMIEHWIAKLDGDE